MNNEQLRLLTLMKEMIYDGKRRFEQRRPDRDYVQDLLDFGISEEEAWKIILSLNKNVYFVDPKPNYLVSGKALTFKRIINGEYAYIKLKIENDSVVCLSFHIDGKE